MVEKSERQNDGSKLVTNLALNDLDELKDSILKRRPKVDTKKEPGKSWVRITWVNGLPYYQLVRKNFREDGTRYLEILQHYGRRPPRGMSKKASGKKGLSL